jgi:peptide/nickel transport system permease protein
MAKFLLRRFANYLLLIVLATSLGYVVAATSLNPRANFEGRNPAPPKASVDAKLSSLNLNDETPVLTRFERWAVPALHGDFGKTIAGQPVSSEMWRRMGVTLRLLVVGSFIGGALGVAVGVIGAVKQYSFTDYTATVSSFVILSIPVFLLAVLLKVGALSVNNHVGHTLLYYTGEKTPSLSGGLWAHATDRFQHFVLPTLSLVLGQIAFYSRYQRSAMLDVLGSDFLRTAQAKGLRRRDALIKHGLRTALIPMATFFAYDFGLLLTGAIFTEKIFGWHGMGEWFIDSITKNDINTVAAVTAFSAVMVLIAGMLADVAYAALDPRVRIS